MILFYIYNMEKIASNNKMLWRSYVGKVAYPTLILAVTLLGMYGTTIYAGIKGMIPLWLCCIINTILTYVLFTPLHEAAHGNISGKNKGMKSVEEAIGWLSGLPLTVPLPMFQHIHFTHHSNTNDEEKDPDYWVASRNPFLVVLKCFTIIGDYYYFFFKETNNQLATPRTKKRFIASVIGLVFIYAVLAFWVMKMSWIYPLMLWLVPAIIASAFLAFAFDWLPHHPHGVQQRYLDTRIILFPGLTFLLISQNMHLIHHLYPNIPFYKYGAAFRKMRKDLEAKGANIEDWLDDKGHKH